MKKLRMLTVLKLPALDLSRLAGRAVVYIYPRTGVPGQPPLSDDWDAIPPGLMACDYTVTDATNVTNVDCRIDSVD
jgi:hypothetical protein